MFHKEKWSMRWSRETTGERLRDRKPGVNDAGEMQMPNWLDDCRLVHKELGGCGPNGSPGDCIGATMDIGMYIINCRVPGTLWMGIKIVTGENRS